jgi:hypothetical protein
MHCSRKRAFSASKLGASGLGTMKCRRDIADQPLNLAFVIALAGAAELVFANR